MSLEGPKQVRPLKDKWRDHWDTRDKIFEIKPENAEKIGVIFFWCYSASLWYSALFVLIPELGRLQESLNWRLKLAVWVITLEAAVNWVLCARRTLSRANKDQIPQTNSASDSNMMQPMKHGWKHCAHCMMESPPRSHHCKVCKFCVLKRDHHCFFTGTCIGFKNQRYFMVLIFYLVIGSAFFIYLTLEYLGDPYPFWSSRGWNLFLPVGAWSWMKGQMYTMHLFLILQAHLAVMLGSVCLFYFVWQILMTYRGQTSFEATRGVHVFRVDPFTHFRSVFGVFWLLNFIVPLPTAQEGDGIHWQNHKNLKGH